MNIVGPTYLHDLEEIIDDYMIGSDGVYSADVRPMRRHPTPMLQAAPSTFIEKSNVLVV